MNDVLSPKTVSKVAQVTFAFWVMKILATTLGETAGDYISMTLNMGYYAGLAITFSALVVILFSQVKLDRYHPWLFWLAIIGTTTAGTEISDFMDRSLHVGYTVGSLILVSGLLMTLGAWYLKYKDLSVYPIVRKEKEMFFWIAVLFSNSLGTAFGDYLVSDLGLHYLQGALVTSAVIAVVVLLHYTKWLNDVLLFWIAFIFTRPFGATFGDFLTKPIADGGLHLPREYASAVTFGLLAIVLIVSTYVMAPKSDTKQIET